jgi:hypothetical protein
MPGPACRDGSQVATLAAGKNPCQPEPDADTAVGLRPRDQGQGRPAPGRAQQRDVPFNRIVRLIIDDVIRGDGEVLLRLGEPPTPVPGPVADLLLQWIGSRDNMNTATNRNSHWLFPGRQAGQPMNPTTLAALAQEVGVPTVAGRIAAIRQHVQEMPGPIVADALGYHPVTIARLAAQSGDTFSRYAPR